jgi:hypothetical protein
MALQRPILVEDDELAPGEAKDLKRGEVKQWRQVAELIAAGEIEQVKRGETLQFWREASQFRKSTQI